MPDFRIDEMPTFNDMRYWADHPQAEWGDLDQEQEAEADLYFQAFDVESPGGRLAVKTGSAPSDADALRQGDDLLLAAAQGLRAPDRDGHGHPACRRRAGHGRPHAMARKTWRLAQIARTARARRRRITGSLRRARRGVRRRQRGGRLGGSASA